MWDNDLVQFARLLCEIQATQDTLRMDLLCESMDIEMRDLAELFDRAHDVWEHAKGWEGTL